MPESNSSRVFDRSLMVMAVFAVLTAGLALIAAVRAPDGAHETDSGSDGEPVVATIALTEFAIDGDLEIPAGEVQIALSNDGAALHNLVFENGPSSEDLNSGETSTFDVGNLEPGTYTIFCAVPGHRDAGMETHLVVGAPGSPPTSEHDEMTPAEMDQVMIDSMLAFPAATEGTGNQPLEPSEVESDGTKIFDLTASIIDWEVSPGEFVEAWAYNGQVPGPWIRLELGDSVEINVTNETPLSTDVHWHGISTPNEMDGVSPYTQDPIGPGETFTYAFEATRPSIGMYHAHLHSQISVPNGMFAPFTIGDTPLPSGQTVSGIEVPADMVPVREIPMVLNDAGTIGLSLNGKSFPATEPYVVAEGDWVVYHYYNEGLQVHPMHQHQFPQLVFAKDGFPLDNPYWADTINVAPGERYSVLVHADAPGTWVWHCHILTHVESDEGMFGMVTALIVEPSES